MALSTDSSANGSVCRLETRSAARDRPAGSARRGEFLPKSFAGFTLIEVVLALGLASFALLALVSLIPVALESSHHAQEITRISKAFQQVTSDLTQGQFANIASIAAATAGTTNFYFDYDGNQKQPGTATAYTSNSPATYYTIVATVSTTPITNQSSSSIYRVKLQAKTRRDTNLNNAPSTTVTVCDMGY